MTNLTFLFSSSQLAWAQVYMLLLSLILTLYDCKYQAYPLLIWLLGSLPLTFFFPLQLSTILLLLLGILAELIELKIGSGDFFYLASLSLVLNWQKLLWLIQLGSWLGIIYIILFRKRKKTIPFVPFLSLAYVLILLFSLF